MKTEKELEHFHEMQISDDEKKRSVSSVAKSVGSGEFSSSSSEWHLGSDKLFVTCLNHDSENKRAKPIINCLNLFIYTSLNHMFIRSCLVSQFKNKFISNSEQLFNAIDLSPITFGIILPPYPRSKNSTNSQN